MTYLELISEAKTRIPEIARATKNCHPSKYVAIYEGENSVPVSTIQIGWDTRTTMISFGSDPMTKKEVQEYLERLEFDTDINYQSEHQ